MKTFKEWTGALAKGCMYGTEPDPKKRFVWMWTDYLNQTFEEAHPPLSLPETHYDAKVESAFNDAPGADDKQKARGALETLSAFSQTLIEKYRRDNVPTQDDGTLCMYHAFSHLPNVPEQQRGALRLCEVWRTKRFVPGFAYDDDRCAQLMAIEYGLTTWSPVKGKDIKEIYTVPGTRLVITLIRKPHKIPDVYWIDRAWYKKAHPVAGSRELEIISTDDESAAHCIYAEVDPAGKIQFFDNENEQGRPTDQLIELALGYRCVVYR